LFFDKRLPFKRGDPTTRSRNRRGVSLQRRRGKHGKRFPGVASKRRGIHLSGRRRSFPPVRRSKKRFTERNHHSMEKRENPCLVEERDSTLRKRQQGGKGAVVPFIGREGGKWSLLPPVTTAPKGERKRESPFFPGPCETRRKKEP